MPLIYHPGQIQVQTEANTRPVAERLASWVGPVGQFTEVADLILLAAAHSAGELRFAAVSGPAPLVEVIGDAAILLPFPRVANLSWRAASITCDAPEDEQAPQ
jgi:hypothetical protein